MHRLFLTTLFLLYSLSLRAFEPPPPLLTVGGGYFDAGRNHSGGLFQAEYHFGSYLFYRVRPQASLLSPSFSSLFIGIGLGVEFYLAQHIVATASLSPGLYIKGSGKDLGYPLEFKEGIDLCYQWENCVRLGGQFYHISNASLGEHNPGANAFVLYLGVPLCY